MHPNSTHEWLSLKTFKGKSHTSRNWEAAGLKVSTQGHVVKGR